MTRAALSPNAWLRYDAVRRVERSVGHIESVLEVGCGLGAMGQRLAAGRRYVGIEPDADSRRVASSRLPEVLPDLDALPPDARFDAVFAFEVLEHCPDDAGTLRSWVERARPGGVVLVSVPADPSRWGPADRYVGHCRRYSTATLETVLAGAGLSGVRSLRYGGPLGYALEAARHRLLGRRLASDAADREARTAASGRQLQPPSASGLAVATATLPFRAMQRIGRPHGPGLLGWGVRASRGERVD